LNPQPSWTELQTYYSAGYEAYDPNHGNEDSDELVLERAKSEGRLRHIPLPLRGRILDVGCGGGSFLRLARALGAAVEGVEPSEFGAAEARKNGFPVFHGTVGEYAASSEAGKFDLITANHVIEHVPDPIGTLASMRRLLTPDGWIWIAVPNAENAIARALHGRWHSTDLPFHLMQFTPGSIALAGRRAGLAVRAQRTESLPGPVASSLRLYLRFRWGVPQRLTARLGILERRIAPRYASRIDRSGAGEAVLTEFTAA
jgi:SAM-dependent methyltransferase